MSNSNFGINTTGNNYSAVNALQLTGANNNNSKGKNDQDSFFVKCCTEFDINIHIDWNEIFQRAWQNFVNFRTQEPRRVQDEVSDIVQRFDSYARRSVVALVHCLLGVPGMTDEEQVEASLWQRVRNSAYFFRWGNLFMRVWANERAGHAQHQAFRAIMSMRQDGVHVPLSTMVKYRGVLVTVQALVPLHPNSTPLCRCVGGGDGDDNNNNNNASNEPKFVEDVVARPQMRRLFESMNVLWKEGQPLPPGIDVRAGTDGRLYIVNAEGFLPVLEPSHNVGGVAAARRMRFEALMMVDAALPHLSDRRHFTELSTAQFVKDVTAHLHALKPSIYQNDPDARLQAQLRRQENVMDQLKKLGMKVSAIGRLFVNAANEEAWNNDQRRVATEVFCVEILARAAKNLFSAVLTSMRLQARAKSVDDCTVAFTEALNSLMAHPMDDCARSLAGSVERKFDLKFERMPSGDKFAMEKELLTLETIRKSKQRLIIARLCKLCGVELVVRTEEELAQLQIMHEQQSGIEHSRGFSSLGREGSNASSHASAPDDLGVFSDIYAQANRHKVEQSEHEQYISQLRFQQSHPFGRFSVKWLALGSEKYPFLPFHFRATDSRFAAAMKSAAALSSSVSLLPSPSAAAGGAPNNQPANPNGLGAGTVGSDDGRGSLEDDPFGFGFGGGGGGGNQDSMVTSPVRLYANGLLQSSFKSMRHGQASSAMRPLTAITTHWKDRFGPNSFEVAQGHIFLCVCHLRTKRVTAAMAAFKEAMIAFANLEKEQSKNKVPESLWLVRYQKYIHVLHVIAELRFVSTMTGVTTCIDLLHAINHAKDLFFIHSSFLVGMCVHSCRDLVETQIRMNDPKNANNSLQSLYPLAVVAEQVVARSCDVCSIESGAISAMLQSARYIVDHAEWMHRSHAAVVLHDNACTRAISILNSIVNIVKSVSDSDAGANEPHLCRYISALALALLSGSAKAKDPIVILDEAEAQIDDAVKVAESVCGQDTKEYEMCLKDQIVLFEKCGRRDEAADIRAHLSQLSKSPFFSARDNLRRLQIQMAQSFRAAEDSIGTSLSGGGGIAGDDEDDDDVPQVMKQHSGGMFSQSSAANFNNHAVVQQYVEDTLTVARAADGKLSVESKSSALVRKASSRALVAQMRREAKVKQKQVRDNIADREKNAKEAREREFNELFAMLDAEEKNARMAVASREGKSLLKLPFMFWPQLINLERQRNITVHDALVLRVALSAVKPFVIARLSRDFIAWKTERKAQQRARILQAAGRGYLCRHDCGVARIRAAERRKAVAKRVETTTKTTVSSRVLELLAARTIARCMAGYRARLHLFIRMSARSMGLNHLIPQNHYLINSASYNNNNNKDGSKNKAGKKTTSPQSQSPQPQQQQQRNQLNNSPSPGRGDNRKNRPSSSGSADASVEIHNHHQQQQPSSTTTALLNLSAEERTRQRRQQQREQEERQRNESPVMKGRRGGGAPARSMSAASPDRKNAAIMLLESAEDENDDRTFLQDAEDERFLKLLEKFYAFFDNQQHPRHQQQQSSPSPRGNLNNNNKYHNEEDEQNAASFGSWGNSSSVNIATSNSPKHGRRSIGTNNNNDSGTMNLSGSQFNNNSQQNVAAENNNGDDNDEGMQNNNTNNTSGRNPRRPHNNNNNVNQQQQQFASSQKVFSPSLRYPRPPPPSIGGWLKDLEKTPNQALRETSTSVVTFNTESQPQQQQHQQQQQQQQQFAHSTRPNRGVQQQQQNQNNSNNGERSRNTTSPQKRLIPPGGNYY